MKGALVLSFVFYLLAVYAVPSGAHTANDGCRNFQQEAEFFGPGSDPFTGTIALRTIVRYDFEQMNWMGWTRVDNTIDVDTFWHVDDFIGVAPGDHLMLIPIEGIKSMWCGGRPNTFHTSYWKSAPGYGNEWEQILETDPFFVTDSLITFECLLRIDAEPNKDILYLECYTGFAWVMVETFTGSGHLSNVYVEVDLPEAAMWTAFRFRFVSDCGGSDEDGTYNSDGAAIVDSLVISYTGGATIDFEDLEAAAVGDHRVDGDNNGIHWNATLPAPFGMYSGIHPSLVDKDPCYDNYSTQIVFFLGSIVPAPDYPGFFETPFCWGWTSPPCQDEMVVSPVIDMTRYSTNNDENQDAAIPPDELSELCKAQLRFQVYRDLPLPNLVFYYWRLRTIDWVTGYPSAWMDRNLVYYGPDRDYFESVQEISDLAANDLVQVAIGVVDMCWAWYTCPFGDCDVHTPAPWIDNVGIIRYEGKGPQWSYRDIDLFQDNFPEDEFELESFVRADMAQDINQCDYPGIRPGDSIVVSVTAPCCIGIDTTAAGEARVYMHVRAYSIGCDATAKPPLFGPSLEGTYGRYVSDDGEWTTFIAERARASNRCCPEDDRYMFDLNDSLFTRGYKIDYYFSAFDFCGNETYLPEEAPEGVYFEFTCLPTLCHGVLFVDDFHGRGTLQGWVEDYWGPTFIAVTPPNGPAPESTLESRVDRYDVNGPSSLVSNGLGSRAKLFQLAVAYEKIIWDSGDLTYGTISDGIVDKSDDCQILLDWMSYSDRDVNLWILGDNIAYELSLSASNCASLLLAACGILRVDDSYYEMTGGELGGGVATPKVRGILPGPFFDYYDEVPDTFCAYGGCPIINRFDCLEKDALSHYALAYGRCECSDPWTPSGLFGGVWKSWVNTVGQFVQTIWCGFSFMYVRDCEVGPPIVRNKLMAHAFDFFGNVTNQDISGDDTPPSFDNHLAHNYPNPFNPLTTIKFGVREEGVVKIKIYNAAGQIVKTLVDEVFEPGMYSRDWKGTNDRGAAVASGIYFYRMETKGFSRTRKMILLR
jgi:hypothetical protein